MTEENEKKKEIRKKAVKLFQENGYEKVTVNDIAKASGISKNTFYYYFDSKESIILALFHPGTTLPEKLMVEVLKEKSAYDQLSVLYKAAASYFSGLGKEIMRTALRLDLSKDMLDRKPEKPVIYEMAKSLYQKAQEEGSVRTDISIHEMIHVTCIALMGCVQIWATSSYDFDLVECFMKSFDVIVKKQ